jgi:CheY-like chemotaxis protein
MLGWSQLLLQGGRDDASLKRGLSTIERNARAQSELIEDMLDMSRLLAGKVRIDSAPLQPRDFIHAALDTTRSAALARQVTLVGDLDAGSGRILGDSGRMQQVMVNLLSNAIKFSEPGGVVTVTLRSVEGASEITVQDTGAGIPAAFLPFVFDRFRQADGSSTRRHGGLGLAIARQLIELQGGVLSVASEGEGQGAAFTLRMPLASGAVPMPVATAPSPGLPLTALALQGLTVLVIDDALDSLELVQAVLAPSQARILTATGAQEALRLIAQHRPDLIISDIGMPVVDGFEFIRKVRALPDRLIASVPVIALTAFSRKEDEQKVLAAGFDEFLAKPLVPAALLQTVAAVNARRTPVPAV